MMQISDLPTGAGRKAYPLRHFPAPYLAVIWRNWNRVSPARIALVLGTTEDKVTAAAAKLGLKRDDSRLEAFRLRGFQTTIRHNWQLLNYEQLLQLLDWTPQRMEAALLEEDFLYIKLSQMKPQCEPVFYRELTPAEEADCRKIAAQMEEVDRRLPQERERPFDFLERLGKLPFRGNPQQEDLRMIFSYSATYGDSLLPESPDPYPEELLSDYAAAGVNTVWLQGILYQLVPWLGEDFAMSARWQERQEMLRKLVARAARYGIKVLLYLNEPRGVPARMKISHEEWRGPLQMNTGCTAFCPWAPGMLDAMGNAVEQLCRAVPGLGGFYTITMSENVTHCYSRVHCGSDDPDPSMAEEMERMCPVCAEHSPAENVAAVMNAIHDGMRRSGVQGMRLIAYTWAWSRDWDEKLLELLAPDVEIMCVSETNVETDCRGYKSVVADYSVSKPGPGEKARRVWEIARETGHRVVAKIQANTSWEMSGIPVIPVPTLVEEHLQNLKRLGIHDFMLGWTLGGFPGGNLELLEHSPEELSQRDFGDCGAEILGIWKTFGEAFRKLPAHRTWVIYYSPLNLGPANLLYPTPSGFPAGMVCGIPYDDLDAWRGHYYPPEVLEDAFREITEEWGGALEKLRALQVKVAAEHRASYENLWQRAEGTYCCLRSTFCQIAFVRRRNEGRLADTREIVQEEMQLAERMLAVILKNSGIGFEAANQYYYNENELREKIISCRWLLDQLPC